MNKNGALELIWIAFGILIAIGLLIFVVLPNLDYLSSIFNYGSEETEIYKANPIPIPAEEAKNIEPHLDKIKGNNKNLIISLIAKVSKGNKNFISDCASVGLMSITPEVAVLNNLKIFETSKQSELKNCDNKELNLEYSNNLREEIKDKEEQEIIEIDQRFNTDLNIKEGSEHINLLIERYKNKQFALAAYYYSSSRFESTCKNNFKVCKHNDKEMADFIDTILSYEAHLNQESANRVPNPEEEIKIRNELKTLSNNRISFNHPNACQATQTTGCTSLEGLPQLAIDFLVKLTEDCDCDIVITGGTEGGHQTHGPGKSIVDLRKTSELKNYVLSNSATSEQISSGRRYRVGSNSYVEEEDHWHVIFRELNT